jgi:UDPglucose--hexose-1-phosphate uridylyltransferase
MYTATDFVGKWEKRWNPLKQGWVVYAAHRNNRPWTVSKNKNIAEQAPEYDPHCYLCPGNARVSGHKNPDYADIYIFDNDHPVVGLHAPEVSNTFLYNDLGLYKKAKAGGIARVVCYDPRHNITLSEAGQHTVAKVLKAWQGEMRMFAKTSGIKNVLIFENKGELVGVSNPHPHCQIYATDFTLTDIAKELEVADTYKKQTGLNLFGQIIKNELNEGSRIIAENAFAVAFIPFFAHYAYEVMLFPKKRHATISTLNDAEVDGIAALFHQIILRYDGLFGFSFPYVLSVHQAPFPAENYPEYHCFLLFQPPLRQPDLKKFLAGPESGVGTFMADTLPEDKAQELRNVKI